MIRSRKHPRRVLVAVVAGAVVALLLDFYAYGAEVMTKVKRADVVFIDTLSEFGPLERQPVAFEHDLHTQALQRQNKDCTTCHMVNERGFVSPRFKRLADTSKETLLTIYHDNCIGCHTEMGQSGTKAGPLTCGGCHPRKTQILSSIQPAGFDLSLHYRHIEASNGKCDTCHHQYDEVRKVLYYAKGQEVSCRDCHRTQTEGNRRSMTLVSHEACIGCHRASSPSAAQEDEPISCTGCHGLKQQQAITELEHVPRLQRGQPDVVFLHAAVADLDASKMNTVPFNHEAHEGATPTCRVCHHETLKACNDCHKLEAGENGINLDTAMHDSRSGHSCVGCHDQKKQDMHCAGCHSLMQQSSMSQYACTRCHRGPRPNDPVVRDHASSQTVISFMAKGTSPFSFPEEKIPKDVTISALEQEYQKVVFPHRKMVTTLLGYIDENKVATAMHGTRDLVCQGCHHRTPASAQPPLCGSCHGKAFSELNLYMPGLLGAYHQECLGCHEEMGIENLSQCTSCHKKKQETPASP